MTPLGFQRENKSKICDDYYSIGHAKKPELVPG